MARRRSCAAFLSAAALSAPASALVVAWLTTGGATAAGGLSPPEYVVEVLQTEQGLPQNSVNALLQSRQGYLWLGTYNGLARFDGVRFVVFDPANTPALASSRIRSLFEAPDGTLWLGHETGDLTCLRGGHFDPLPVPGNEAGSALVAMELDAAGDLWALRAEGQLQRVRDGRLLLPSSHLAHGVGTPSLARDRDGRLWFARDGELATVDGGELKPFSGAGEGFFAAAICSSPRGGLWIAGSVGVRRWSAGGWADDLGDQPWGREGFVTCMMETRAGAVVVGTLSQGLYLLRGGQPVQHLTSSNGLQREWVSSLCEDREGDLWVGTAGGGLHALRESKVRRLIAPDRWQAHGLLSVSAAGNGGLWIGTEGAGIYHWRDGAWSHYGQEAGLSNLFVWSVSEDASGQLWAGTWGGGLFIQRDGRFVRPQGLEDPRLVVTAILHGRGGVTWVGTSLGLVRYEAGRTQWFGRTQGLALPDVRCVTEDAQGVIWFGMSGGGLGRLEGSTLRQLRKSHGLSSDFVQCLHADPDGTLWIGTHGGGLNRLKDGHFTALTTEQGLPNNVLSHIASDESGHVWIGTHGGLFRVAHDDLQRCADRQSPLVNGLTYGRDDGLPSAECAAGLQAGGTRTPDGWLWIPTAKGVAGLDPRAVKTNLLAPPVLIEELRVDGVSVSLRGLTQINIGPGRQRFDFRYTALSFVAPDKVRFSYRLEGLEPEWVDAGARRRVVYSFLQPGKYVFHVRACNSDGVWNEVGAALPLTVLPHAWQTWWFRSLAAVLALAAVAGGVGLATRRRARRHLERVERQRAVERERTRIAKDMHDDLGASLTRITLLSQSARGELDRPEQAAEDLDRIYSTARELTRALDEIVWAVNPQHDTLDSLANYLGRFAQEFLRPAGIRCRLDVPLALPHWPLTAEARHNLFLAVKEALHNVVRHASASEVNIVMKLGPADFALLITDNGRGFAPATSAATPDDPLRLAHGNGLQNMRRRLEEIGGRCEITGTEGGGTTARFSLPVTATGK